MGAKSKGKANKLARMSEEERLRYLQHRAAIEEEAKRRKEQLISTFMKNKLRKEQMFSRLNTAKINQQWRQVLREIKCIDLRQDLEDLLRWFDHTASKKNQDIVTLSADLAEAETQYSRIQQCQAQATSKFIEIHEQRTGHFHKEYKTRKNDICQNAKADIDDIIKSFTTDEENLNATLFRMEKTFEEKTAAITSRQIAKVDELRNNVLTDLENLKTSRELRIEEIWKNIESVLREYWEMTEDRRRQYSVLRDADYENCKQIFENNEQINSVIDVIGGLKEQLAKADVTRNQQILESENKREQSRRLFFTAKKNIDDEMETDKKNLNFMNSAAGKTTEELEKILETGTQILNLQTLCRKLETLNEKICPESLGDKPQISEEEENVIQEESEKRQEPIADEASSVVVKLDKFWKRYNRAFLEKEALALHYKSLLNEQKVLKSLLKNYLENVVVKRPESKVSYANGIRFCHPRPKTAISERTHFSYVPVVEATQSPSIRQIISAQTKKVYG